MIRYPLLLLLVCGITAISQNCKNTLSGVVVDFHDGSVLDGATLIIAGTEKAVQSNLDGEFVFTNLCDQTYAIQISHPHCTTKGYSIRISGNTKKTFRLEHHLEELNEVMVEASTTQNKTKTIFESKISKDQLERFSNGSLGDAINSLSGVSSLRTGNTVVKPLINGLHSSRVVIINNGVRMEDQEWGAEHAPNVDINTAGGLTLIKGAGALQYSGDAVGGVIVSEAIKPPIKDSLYGKTIVTGATNGRGATITSQLTKSYQNGWYGTLQGTAKRFGDFEAPDYMLSNTGIFERNLSMRVGINRYTYGIEGYYSLFKNEIGILRASHLGGAQDQVRAINSDRPLVVEDFTYDIGAPKQDVTHHLARLKGFRRFDGFGKLSVQYDFQQNNRLEFDIRRGDDSEKASVDLQLTSHTLLLDLDTDVSEETNLKVGLLGKFQENFANPNTGVRRLIPDYTKYNLGVYGVADYAINDSWIVEAGARFDYTFMDVFKFYRTSFWESRNYDTIFPEIVVEESNNQILTNPNLHFYNASGTLGATYSFANEYNLFFNYSLASRAPNASELFSEGLHHSASRIELGDLQFDSEISQRVALTLQRENDVFGFSINPYFNSINNFIVIEPTEIQQTVRGNFQVWEYRQTNAQLIGVDLDGSYAFADHWKFTHQFSLVKGYDITKKEALIQMPPATTTNELVYQNSKINNLRLALQSEYVFRQNEFPDTNFEVFVAETGTNELVDLSTPPDAYHLLHFNSSIELKVNKASQLSLGLSITNLLNTSYRNYLNRLRYYADDLGRNVVVQIKMNY